MKLRSLYVKVEYYSFLIAIDMLLVLHNKDSYKLVAQFCTRLMVIRYTSATGLTCVYYNPEIMCFSSQQQDADSGDLFGCTACHTNLCR